MRGERGEEDWRREVGGEGRRGKGERGGKRVMEGEERRGTEERGWDEKGGRKEVGGGGLEERGMGGEGWYSEQDL